MTNELETKSYLDSRDLIARLAELEDMTEEEREEDDLQDEYEELVRVCEEGENEVEDWTYGATLIREDHFADYIQEVAVDCGYVPSDIPWWISIDWDDTADNCKVAYTTIDILGVTYYAR